MIVTVLILSFLLLFSLLFNIVAAFSVSKIKARVYNFVLDILDFEDDLSDYQEHLALVLKLEVYESEPVINDMLNHTGFMHRKTKNLLTYLENSQNEEEAPPEHEGEMIE